MNALIRAAMAGRINVDNPITILAYSGEDKLMGKYPRKLFETLTIFKDAQGDVRYSPTYNLGFVPSRIEKIDRKIFLDQFLFFESITTHHLSIKLSDSLQEYISNQGDYKKEDSPLSKRLSWISQEANTSNKKAINRIQNILILRNQVVHNLEPKFLQYTIGNKKEVYKPDNPKLINSVTKVMWDGMGALCAEYTKLQPTLESWVNDASANAPKQIIFKTDGKYIDGVKVPS